MKKLFLSFVAIAAMVFASSCQQEKMEPELAGGSTVTFAVEIPDAVGTRAAAVGGTATEINDLVYAVYKTTAISVEKALEDWSGTTTLLYTVNPNGSSFQSNQGTSKSEVISLELLNDQNHIVLLWAQKNDVWVRGQGADIDLTNIQYPSEIMTLNKNVADKYAAFSGVKFIPANTRVNNEPIKLTRPFAQINLATVKPGKDLYEGAFANFKITGTVVTVKGAGKNFNVAAEGPTKTEKINITYNWETKVFDDALTVNSQDYDHYVAMGYVFANGNVKVDYEIKTDIHGNITNLIDNVPVAKNYRTNIIGNLLTSTVGYNVVLDMNWGDEGKNMEVLEEGIVKNINGDYEVTTAAGLAYAINNLFANGGNFYILNTIDMTGVKYDPSNIPSGVTVNFVGQMPVVTRSAEEPIVITGLEYGAIINTNNGSAYINNIKVAGSDESAEVPAFINVNNGTADFTNCEATTQSFIGENNGTITESENTTNKDTPIVKEDNGETLTKVGTADELVAALVAKKGVVFTSDIKIEPASMSNAYGTTGINVKYGQTIDGAGYTLNITGAGGTWDSGINTTGGLIKNLTVTGSFRGIFINHNSTHSETVVLDNVTLKNVVYTISCDQGLYQNLVATNSKFYGWTSYAATLGTAKFTNCTFGEGNGYAYCRPYAPSEFSNCKFEAGYEMDARAEVTINNCTLDGKALTSENLSDLVKSNIANAGSPTNVGTADALVEALEKNENVFFTNDIKIEPANMSNAYGTTGINVKNGQAIYGNGKTLNIKGAGGTWDSGINTTGGLIKDLTVTGSFRGIFINHNSTNSDTVVLDNVTLENVVYTISCDQGLNQNLVATNSKFYGWTSYAATLGTAKFTNCTFGEGNGYAYCRPYARTEFVDCAFEAGFEMDPRAAVTFENCTIDGVALTVENIETLVTSNIANVTSINGKTATLCYNSITNKEGVEYTGDHFESGPMKNALWFNKYVFGGDAAINVKDKTYGAIIIENCSGNFKHDVITIDNDNNSVMILENLDLTLAEGKKLIKSTKTIYQVFMANITINGVKQTQESIAEYLENVEWYQVVEEI